MEEADESVLKTALPPATDYLTYLTILEYNLNRNELPLLHELLQDEKLVTNIGWDLVHLLVPLLPESRQCLEDVASLGNPREVILKVTEELDRIQNQLDQSASEGSEHDSDDGETTVPHHGRGKTSEHEDVHQRQDRSRETRTFETLLQMLCMLHPRIKTKKPSRFLETSILAILRAYRTIAASADATRAVLMFLKRISGSSRPALPPRSGEPPIPTVAAHEPAPDPEANTDGQADGEADAQVHLLQVLISHMIEMHLEALQGADLPAPLAWTDRYVAKEFPERFLSQRKTSTATFAETEELRMRELLVNQILNVAMTDLHMDWVALLSICREPREPQGDDPPSDLPEIPRRGTLCLLTACIARRSASSTQQDQTLTFHDHDQITTNILGDPQISLNTDMPAAAVDAILRSGWAAAQNLDFSSSAEVEHDEAFNKYLQKLSALASTQNSDSLRFNAYLLTTHVLQSHLSSRARLSFIRDTLSFCPYSNLKEVAVGWVREEFVSLVRGGFEEAQTARNVFAEPRTLHDLASILYVIEDNLVAENLPFDEPLYQASLNLLYLLCTSKPMREHLEVSKVVREVDVEAKFLLPLEKAIHREHEAAGGGAATGGNQSDLSILEFGIGTARDGLKQLQKVHS